MNTTDLLLQMTLAATQIAQNTAPPVSDRTEDAGDRRDFSTLLAEKRGGGGRNGNRTRSFREPKG